jgi:hypothetical protein
LTRCLSLDRLVGGATLVLRVLNGLGYGMSPSVGLVAMNVKLGGR